MMAMLQPPLVLTGLQRLLATRSVRVHSGVLCFLCLKHTRVQLGGYTIPQLKECLSGLGLRVGGKKQELVDRIKEHYKVA